METRLAANTIHTSGKRLWRKIRGRETCTPPQTTLEENYKVTTGWYGTRYIGITIDWGYERRQVHLSFPGYTDKALKQLNHT